MYITPVSSNYSNQNIYKQQRVSQPSFKGVLNEAQYERVIRTIAARNTEVFENFSGTKLNEVIQDLMKKYKCLGLRSCGIQIVSNDSLPKLLGEDFTKYNTAGKHGLSVVVGDKYGPVENMKNIYEAKTFLATETNFRK